MRLLPEGCGVGEDAPPLTKEEEKRAYRCQAQLAEDEARAEIESEGIELLTSSKTNTGYRCVSASQVTRLGVSTYEVVPNKDGKKVHLGKFKSKLQVSAHERTEAAKAEETSFSALLVRSLVERSPRRPRRPRSALLFRSLLPCVRPPLSLSSLSNGRRLASPLGRPRSPSTGTCKASAPPRQRAPARSGVAMPSTPILTPALTLNQGRWLEAVWRCLQPQP